MFSQVESGFHSCFSRQSTKLHVQIMALKNRIIGPRRLLRIKETLDNMLLNSTISEYHRARLLDLLDPNQPLVADGVNQRQDRHPAITNHEGHTKEGVDIMAVSDGSSYVLPVESFRHKSAAQPCRKRTFRFLIASRDETGNLGRPGTTLAATSFTSSLTLDTNWTHAANTGIGICCWR